MKDKHLVILNSLFLSIILLILGYILFQKIFSNINSNYKFPNYNVILIIIDTLRADHFPCYGYERNTSPTISRLANESILFENAIAPSSWTKPSVASILSGLYPKTHGAMTRKDVLQKDILLLPEFLKKIGYNAYAFVANGNVTEAFGFNQGYNYFLFLEPGKKFPYAYSDEVNKVAIPFIRNNISEPFFLLIHYNDPHEPHFPPDSIRKFSKNNIQEPYINFEEFIAKYSGDLDATQELINCYDDEILFNDTQLEKIFEILEEKKYLKKSIIVIAGDHGQEFYEHQRYAHGQALYEESIKVPLLIKLPNLTIGRINEQVSLVDITPTILDLLELEIPSYMQGISLIRLEELNKRNEVYSELVLDKFESYSIRTLKNKLYFQIKPVAKYQYFDLKFDPREQNNLFQKEANNPEKIKLEKRLSMWKKTDIYNGSRNKELDEEQKRILKTLGYIK